MPFEWRRQAVHQIDEFMDFSYPENDDNSVRNGNIEEQNMKKCNIISSLSICECKSFN